MKRISVAGSYKSVPKTETFLLACPTTESRCVIFYATNEIYETYERMVNKNEEIFGLNLRRNEKSL